MKAIKRQSLSEQVVESVLRYIKDKDLKVGDQIPTENELADFFQVSRTSIREAMKALSINGVVLSTPGKGTFLQPKAMDTVIGQDGTLQTKARATIAEIMEIRTPLEVLAIGLAAQRGTEEEFEELIEITQKYREAVLVNDCWTQWGTKFHSKIAEMSRNPLLISTLRFLANTVEQYRENLAAFYEDKAYYIESHKRICVALRCRDVEAVQAEMQEHMKMTEDALSMIVDEENAIEFLPHQ
ncbi:MAG: FadR/GntR family transcriptional regulator [Anaerotignum sp.]|nr:FadR/GntR family transcriptional regulator [Anaerotignum sp.]